MNTFEFLSYLRSLGIRLWADGERLRYSAPQGVLTPELRATLAEHKADILSFLHQVHSAPSSPLLFLSPVSRDKNLPLSFAQQRLWFLDQLEPGGFAYHIPVAFRLTGPLNITALQQSLNEIVRRHESLSTTFPEVEGQPIQVITPPIGLKLQVKEFQELPESQREAEAQRWCINEAQRPFDLAHGPLLRASLLRLAAHEHVLLFTVHHMVFDRWSVGVFAHELTELYRAFCTGQSSLLPALPIQYADYAVWQRQWLQGEVFNTQLVYWKNQLASAPAVLTLPIDRPRPAIQTSRGVRQALLLPSALRTALETLSRSEGVTLFMTLLAAFQTLLYRYSGQEDLCVGSPIAGRTRTEIEGLIGFFVNTLVLRTDLSGNPPFRELLRRVREVALGAYAHQDLPFEKLVEELQPERSLSHTPLFQVMFILQNVPPAPTTMAGLTLSWEPIDIGAAMFDVTLFVVPQDTGLKVTLEYNTDLFDATTIHRLLAHWHTLLESIVVQPEVPIATVSLLTEAERHHLLVEWNATAAAYPQERCVHELIESQVAQTPDAIAVVAADQRLTYRQLHSRANQLARYLRARGVGPEVLVGIYVDRSLEMVIGLLGILKANGAYVPLDPTYPRERLALMLEDAQVPVLLTQQRLVASLPAHRAAVVCLDTDWEAIARESSDDLTNYAIPENLAYVIYTSGSTGTPKGVQIPHRAVVNFLHAMRHQPGLSSQDILLAVTTLSFDIAALELFLPLIVGAQTVLISRDEAADGQRLLQQLNAASATVLQATPTTWRLLLEAGWSGSPQVRLFCGGEALPWELAAQLRTRGAALWNMYGPTETTIWSAVAKVDAQAQAVSLGRPIANTQFFVLDGHLQPVPVGVPGELYIGGTGVARGYLHRPELTAERFLPDPFSTVAAARMYKTGDLVRYRTEGVLEFLGRIDQQVKMRGFRIELGEIEAVLEHHPAVQRAVVLAREDIPGDMRLVAYVVPTEIPATPGELRSFLRAKLPNYMVPSAFVQLTDLPLTPNGKVDRRALSAPEQTRSEPVDTFVAPRDGLERQLIQLWEQVIGIRPIGVQDNFFELGGHSLLAVRLFAQIKEVFGQHLPLATLFQAPTVAQLANVLRQECESAPWSCLVAMQPGGRKRPLFCVHPGGSNVLCFADLVRYLGPDQPVYGLQAQGLDGQLPPHTRVEDMAAHYIREIRTVQPKGPYLLGGVCFGCIIAFEMAQQLQAQGQQVALLLMMDTYPPPGLFHGSLGYYVRRVAYIMRHRPAVLRHYLWALVPSKVKKAIYTLSAEDRFLQHITHVAATHVQARKNYCPRPYAGHAVFFWSDEFAHVSAYQAEWTKLIAGKARHHVLPVVHGAMLREPHVQVLAKQVGAYLEQLDQPL